MPFDFVSRLLYLAALALALVLAALYLTGHTSRLRFDASSWALAFPLEALAIATLLYAAAVPGSLTTGMAYAGLAVASVATLVLALHTVQSLLMGGIFVMVSGRGQAGAGCRVWPACPCCCRHPLPTAIPTPPGHPPRTSQPPHQLPPLCPAGSQVRPSVPADPHTRGLPLRRRAPQGGGGGAGAVPQNGRGRRPRPGRLCTAVQALPPGPRLACAPGGNRHLQASRRRGAGAGAARGAGANLPVLSAWWQEVVSHSLGPATSSAAPPVAPPAATL